MFGAGRSRAIAALYSSEKTSVAGAVMRDCSDRRGELGECGARSDSVVDCGASADEEAFPLVGEEGRDSEPARFERLACRRSRVPKFMT